MPLNVILPVIVVDLAFDLPLLLGLFLGTFTLKPLMVKTLLLEVNVTSLFCVSLTAVQAAAAADSHVLSSFFSHLSYL